MFSLPNWGDKSISVLFIYTLQITCIMLYFIVSYLSFFFSSLYLDYNINKINETVFKVFCYFVYVNMIYTVCYMLGYNQPYKCSFNTLFLTHCGVSDTHCRQKNFKKPKRWKQRRCHDGVLYCVLVACFFLFFKKINFATEFASAHFQDVLPEYLSRHMKISSTSFAMF